MGKDAKILILGSLAAGLLLVTGAPWLARAEADAFAPSREGAAQGGTAGLGGPFAPTDQNGRRVTDTRVLAEPALPYFGYACCPGVCPMDNARNAEAVSIPEERGIRATPVFITVDPRRDTPEMLKDFAAAIHPRMIGLTGSRAEIDAVSTHILQVSR
ncbi:SCO family protein [Paracoccus binzhouensis]|uniref:SCO family protein n=1 Tax=Paracoccus binzhouensis TaxID=2796149 RepID=UPI0018EF0D02|nr:SCO family protein [Paracoccus binzhouensis]